MDQLVLEDLKLNYKAAGMDPSVMPAFKERYSSEELLLRQAEYADMLDISRYFADKFLSNLPGDPMLVSINDGEGYVMGFGGNQAMIGQIREFGIVEGVRFTEDMGINSVVLCLQSRQPVQLIATDHYHIPLHATACYSAPLFEYPGADRAYATLSLMTMADNAHPQLLALLCTMADSIERELLLRRQNTQQQILTQALLETNHYGVILTDDKGEILSINNSASDMLSLKGLGMDGIQDSSRLPLVGRYFDQLLQRSSVSIVGQELLDKRPGIQRHFILDIVPIYDEDYRLIRTVGTLREITEAKRAEELVRNSEKLVFAGQLAVGIAHEIRNPLTTIRGMLQFSSSRELKPDHYQLVMSEIDRIGLILNDFLGLGKSRSLNFNPEPPQALLEETLQMFEFQCRQENIRLLREYNSLSNIFCERNQMKQVFLNILRNASEAMPGGGEIVIRLETQGEFQRIIFHDTGEGIAHEELKRIGEPFHTTKTGGNGIGLMIVKRILAAHGGSLDITSTLGEGTTVTIELPLASIHDQGQQENYPEHDKEARQEVHLS